MPHLLMNDTNFNTISQVKAFLGASNAINVTILDKADRLIWIQKVLLRFKYRSLPKKSRGLIRKYITKFTGYSKPQLSRLIQKHYEGTLLKKTYQRNSFTGKYTNEDISLLIETDKAHKRLSGNATKEIFRREYEIFGNRGFVRLKDISVSHIYNLRGTKLYLRNTSFFSQTIPAKVNIGTRTKPRTDGKPGYLRVDTVHQGDLDGEKGVYHINMVDEVVQWEIIGCVETISYQHMGPLLKFMINHFPFIIRGFHADNGSEYINYEVVKMLNKLLIQLTKSRARRTNDNALVESKNGAVIRKHMGYIHIPGKNARKINRFYHEFFNPYLNFHRPAAFATVITDKRGKQKKKYDQYTTPYEKLKSLDNANEYLKDDITFAELDKIAYAECDNQAAWKMMEEKRRLFKSFR